MNTPHARRAARIIGGTVLTGALLATPAVATATPFASEGSGAGCTVTDGTLNWGLKESFRNYIDGSIANGSWEASDGAEYVSPEFVWGSPTGSIDPETGTGSVSFPGTVHFTGHDGLLDLTLANPTVEFEGDGTAALLLDSRSTDTSGEVVVDELQEWVGAVTVDSDLDPVDQTLELSGLPVSLTNSGAGAFAGFYEAETELDPLSMSLTLEGCDGAAPADASEDEGAAQVDEEPQPVAAPAEIPWLPIGIGGAALFVIGLTIGILIGGRRRSAAPKSVDRNNGGRTDDEQKGGEQAPEN